MDSVKTELECLIKGLRFGKDIEKDYKNLCKKIYLYYAEGNITEEYAKYCVWAAYYEYCSIFLFRFRRGDFDEKNKSCETCYNYSPGSVGICKITGRPVFPKFLCNNYELNIVEVFDPYGKKEK